MVVMTIGLQKADTGFARGCGFDAGAGCGGAGNFSDHVCPVRAGSQRNANSSLDRTSKAISRFHGLYFGAGIRQKGKQVSSSSIRGAYLFF